MIIVLTRTVWNVGGPVAVGGGPVEDETGRAAHLVALAVIADEVRGA